MFIYLKHRKKYFFLPLSLDFRDSQKLQTSKHVQANTIQIVRALARDLTMAAAGHAYGMARAAPGITLFHHKLVDNKKVREKRKKEKH